MAAKIAHFCLLTSIFSWKYDFQYLFLYVFGVKEPKSDHFKLLKWSENDLCALMSFFDKFPLLKSC